MVSFLKNDIVVFVGPNNSGKSAALAALAHLFASSDHKAQVITAISKELIGDKEDLLAWLKVTSYVSHPVNSHMQMFGTYGTLRDIVSSDTATTYWKMAGQGHGMGPLAGF